MRRLSRLVDNGEGGGSKFRGPYIRAGALPCYDLQIDERVAGLVAESLKEFLEGANVNALCGRQRACRALQLSAMAGHEE